MNLKVQFMLCVWVLICTMALMCSSLVQAEPVITSDGCNTTTCNGDSCTTTLAWCGHLFIPSNIYPSTGDCIHAPTESKPIESGISLDTKQTGHFDFIDVDGVRIWHR